MNNYLVEIIIGKVFNDLGEITRYLTQSETIQANSMSEAYKPYEQFEVQITKVSGGLK